MSCKESQGHSFPDDLDFQQCFGKNGKGVIVPANDWQATQPNDMILAIIGFTDGEIHPQLLGKHGCMSTISGFEQGDHIWLLLLDDTEKKGKATFAAR
jgi:hypothetical protein